MYGNIRTSYRMAGKTKMKFIRIGSLVINTTSIRTLQHKEGDYNSPPRCFIYYTSSEWDEVVMNETEFNEILERLDNVNLLIS